MVLPRGADFGTQQPQIDNAAGAKVNAPGLRICRAIGPRAVWRCSNWSPQLTLPKKYSMATRNLSQKFLVSHWDLAFNPFYFIRDLLYRSIRAHANQLTGHLLDFGCGSKPYQHLFTHTKTYTGVDFEGGGNPYEKTRVDVYYDGKHLPFETNHFDSVLATEVFEHLFNLDEILQELKRVLKPGGKMLITCPFLWPEHEQPWDFARYSSFGIKALLERHGFQVVVQEKTGNYLLCVHQLIVLYIYYLIPKIPVLYHLLYLVITLFFTLLTLLLQLVLPKKLKRNDLYLNNVLVVQKPAST
jgi:SAM-dependent methyltransferase